MYFNMRKAIVSSLLLVLGLCAPAWAQNARPSEGTPIQRLDVLRQKVDSARRSLSGAISAFKDEDKTDKKKDDKTAVETPVARLKSLEKEAASLQSQVSNLRGKVDRSEKYEASDIERCLSVQEFASQFQQKNRQTICRRNHGSQSEFSPCRQ
jgi:predicted RNase H-like nuclease (RuvC/YqgF family)